jgi:hypothetical protein
LLRVLSVEDHDVGDAYAANWNKGNQSGLDGFGYRWVDNQTPDTASYSWVEIKTNSLPPFAISLSGAVAMT